MSKAGDRAPPMLDESALAGLNISQSEIVDAIADAIRDEAAGRILTTPKSALLPGDGRYMMTTLSTADAPPLSIVKFVTVSPDNPDRGLPTINGSILIHDSRTGLLQAVLDANWITAVRTAGLSGVAARELANPGACKMGFVGAGVQARSHLDLLAEMFPLQHIAIYSRGAENIARLKARAEARGLDVAICSSPRDAISDADLIVTSVTLTTVDKPFLDAGWMKPGAFATITDLAAPWRRDSFAALGRAVIDDMAQEAASPEPMIDPALVLGDLKALVTGAVKTGHDPQSSAAFIFRGLAIGDFAIAALAWRRVLANRQ